MFPTYSRRFRRTALAGSRGLAAELDLTLPVEMTRAPASLRRIFLLIFFHPFDFILHPYLYRAEVIVHSGKAMVEVFKARQNEMAPMTDAADLPIDPITLEVIGHGLVMIADRYSFGFALS